MRPKAEALGYLEAKAAGLYPMLHSSTLSSKKLLGGNPGV